ncbi:MAG: hypothetical protein IJT54_03550 [Candidatus Methanomethylophilaceae archaeon]|nr:hypothetical protein [Candidatus Methanomethylophilaceae archaeon]
MSSDILISLDSVTDAVVIVMMMLMILSVPSIFLTVRSSSVLLKKYTMLRAIENVEDEKNMPDHVLNEWKSIKSPVGYMSLVVNEIEKLDALRPAFFQAELAVVLSIVLAIYPGLETNVLILFIILDVLCVISIVYGHVYAFAYKREYAKILEDINNEEKKGAVDGMYG